MQRSHLTLGLFALVAALWSTQCNSLSDDCKKTLTCGDDAGAPRLDLVDCTWRFPDGGEWKDGPSKTASGTWEWPNGDPAPSFNCTGSGGSGGSGSDDNCTDGIETPEPGAVLCTPLYCNTTTDTCVQCLTNDHCANRADAGPEPGLVCDPTSQRCVACVIDTDCQGTGKRYCQRSADPTQNECVSCIRDVDCGDTEVCDEPTGECTLRCSASEDNCRGDKPICNLDAGVCVECLDDATCSGGTPECNIDTKECVPCVTNAPCMALGRVCDVPANECVRCLETPHCDQEEVARYCDVPTRACVECLTSDQCTNVAESRCNPGTHTCETCTLDEQCEMAAPRCRPSDGRCVQCIDDVDCPGGHCDPATNACVECLTDQHCPLVDAARCDLATHTCEPCDGVGGFTECTGKTVGGLCRINDGLCVNCLDNPGCVPSGPGLSRCGGAGNCVACAVDSDCDLFSGRRACRVNAINPGCVECVNNNHCTNNPDGPRCKTTAGGGTGAINTCVECLSNADCLDPAESFCNGDNRCVPCLENGECSHLSNLGVCDLSQGDGVCVQCTGLQRQACGANVCNSLTRQCTNLAARTAGVCDACVSDQHCAATQLCVQQTFDDRAVGFFCFERQTAGGCATRPYAQSIPGAVSIDRAESSICGLALTTCPALADFEVAAPCGTAAAPNSALCGETDFDDGVCLPVGASAFCSIPCGGSALNCTGGACEAQVCALN